MVFVKELECLVDVRRRPFERIVVGHVWMEENLSDFLYLILWEGDLGVGLEEGFEGAVFFDGGEAFFGSVAFDAVVEVGAEEDRDVDELFPGYLVGFESLVEAEELGEDFDEGLFSGEFAAF